MARIFTEYEKITNLIKIEERNLVNLDKYKYLKREGDYEKSVLISNKIIELKRKRQLLYFKERLTTAMAIDKGENYEK